MRCACVNQHTSEVPHYFFWSYQDSFVELSIEQIIELNHYSQLGIVNMCFVETSYSIPSIYEAKRR
jgi:hypothetical protein